MPHALHFLVFTMAGWLNRHQEDLIDYLREENRVLRMPESRYLASPAIAEGCLLFRSVSDLYCVNGTG